MVNRNTENRLVALHNDKVLAEAEQNIERMSDREFDRVMRLNSDDIIAGTLLEAIQHRRAKLVRRLVAYRHYLPTHNYPLVFAAHAGDCVVMRALVESRKFLVHDPDMAMSPLCIAALKGNLDLVRFLLGVDNVNAFDECNTAFFLAAQCGHARVCRLMLADPRVDPNFCADDDVENAPVRVAAQHGHYRICKMLVADDRVRTDFAEEGRGSLTHLAAAGGHLGVFKLLVDAGIVGRRDMSESLLAAALANARGVADLIISTRSLLALVDLGRVFIHVRETEHGEWFRELLTKHANYRAVRYVLRKY